LVNQAIQAGIFNDLGSGGNVDICLISNTSGVKMMRNYEKPNERLFRSDLKGYHFPRGTTAVIAEAKRLFRDHVEVHDVPMHPRESLEAALPSSSSSSSKRETVF